ncbi:unnamed protein product [Amaranthus hypochondriacus]
MKNETQEKHESKINSGINNGVSATTTIVTSSFKVEVTDQSITQATTDQVSKPKTPHVDGGKGGQNY